MGKFGNRSRLKRSRAAMALGLVGALITSIGVVLLAASPAAADGTVTWEGNGAGEICDGTLHWIYTGQSDTAPVLSVGGGEYAGARKGRGSAQSAWHFYTPSVGVTPTSPASVAYTGEAGTNPVLTISSCAPTGLIGVDPTDPTLVPSRCVGDEPQPWSAILPSSDGPISYSRVGAVVTATIKDTSTHVWDLDPGSRWTRTGESTATYTFTDAEMALVTCGKTDATPVDPTLVPSRCVGNQPQPWSATLPSSDGPISYSRVGAVVTATIKDTSTHVWDLDPGSRWIKTGDSTATYTFTDAEMASASCGTSTLRTVSEERKSCARGVEVRTGTVTTVNGQAQAPRWGDWTISRVLDNAEFEQLGCRPDQPEPVELLGAETRMDCAGVEERSSTQVTTFEWNEDTREYEQVVGALEWSDWVKVRNLSNKELRAEGCVLGEETLVPKPKPEQKPTVKGVERVAPPAAVPTAVAAGAGGEAGSSTAQLLAQILLGGGMLLLLASGWVGFGRREAGAHEA